MSADFFLDTNVFVYSFDPAVPRKAEIALALIHRAVRTRQDIVSHQVVQEFFNIALQKFTPRMQTDQAVRYLTEVFQPIFHTLAFASLYSQALQAQGRYQLPWYDSLIVTAAMQAGCAVLYTEDMQHGQRFDKLVIRNPFL